MGRAHQGKGHPAWGEISVPCARDSGIRKTSAQREKEVMNKENMTREGRGWLLT